MNTSYGQHNTYSCIVYSLPSVYVHIWYEEKQT